MQILVSGENKVRAYHLRYEGDGSVQPFWNVSVTGQQRGRRNISAVTDAPCEDLEAEAGSKCAFCVNL